MKNKRKTKQEKIIKSYVLTGKNLSAGITLIAMVVTIVVLLILAGVTLNLVIGNNGIISNAIKAKTLQHVAEIEDIKELENINIKMENEASFNEGKDRVYDKLNNMNLLYDTQIIENMIIVSQKYPIFLTSNEKPIELDKNLYDYEINQDFTAKITKYKGNEENIVVPSHVTEEGKVYVITAVGDGCFADNQSIKEIKMLDNIVEIGSWAFQRSNNIKKISMSDSVKKLNYYGCFGNLEKLEEITLSENITVITHSSFMNDHNLKKINIPNGVTKIEESAFINCYRLEEIVMPELVKSIGNSAFENVGFSGYGNCIKRISLNEGLETIGERAFANCHCIAENLILPSTINNIGTSAFESFGVTSGKKVYYFDGTEY